MQHLALDWYEGLFLRPHHFQALERHWAEQDATSHQWDFPFHYGLQALEFSPEALANYHFEVRRLHRGCATARSSILRPGRSPIGLTSARRSRAAAEEQEKLAVGLQHAFESEATVRVFLAIPRTKLGRANVQTGPSDGDTRYSRTTIAVQDENRSGHEQELQFRRLNARLLLSTEDASGYELLPIAQIKRASDAGARPQIDPGIHSAGHLHRRLAGPGTRHRAGRV